MLQRLGGLSAPGAATISRPGKKYSPLQLPPMTYERWWTTRSQKNVGDVAVARVAGQLVFAGRADDLRDLRVGV